ncbi:Hsp20/alpha crystallin family protein [Salidesulfovibrio brasiliensis]|uniref:Hsp20/alpha crystallin family protein n=1 Tax=Salidesulfovibrio brasiliensis TaxID=221711 RepID=UPI0006D123C8|nr:Hsp20/alpha crystallin family protein [Salidesulfovibrio brasiliensis]
MSDIRKKENAKLPVYRPATDIMEEEKGFSVYMDMPGVPKENLVIDLEENELTVSGTTAQAAAGEQLAEQQFGGCEYRQTISLSDIVDRERIAAKVQDGVLEITLPRAAAHEPKRIEITQG